MATVRSDGTGEVVVDGRTIPIEGRDLTEAGKVAVELVASRAAQWGRSVRMTAQSPAGCRIVMVHPDGRVTEDDDVPHARRALRLAVAAACVLVLGLAGWIVARGAVPGRAAGGDLEPADVPSAVVEQAPVAPLVPSQIPADGPISPQVLAGEVEQAPADPPAASQAPAGMPNPQDPAGEVGQLPADAPIAPPVQADTPGSPSLSAEDETRATDPSTPESADDVSASTATPGDIPAQAGQSEASATPTPKATAKAKARPKAKRPAPVVPSRPTWRPAPRGQGNNDFLLWQDE